MIWQIVPESNQNAFAIRFDGPIDVALQQYSELWQNLNLGELNYEFLDDMVAQQYRNEKQLSTFVTIISMILILISSSGLYGMMLFFVEEKKNEIGIRKVLGASVRHLLIQLNKHHVILMVIGFAAGIPAALYFTIKWLNNFAYHIAPSWYHIVFALFICFLFAIASISILTWNAAVREPAEVLREE